MPTHETLEEDKKDWSPRRFFKFGVIQSLSHANFVIFWPLPALMSQIITLPSLLWYQIFFKQYSELILIKPTLQLLFFLMCYLLSNEISAIKPSWTYGILLLAVPMQRKIYLILECPECHLLLKKRYFHELNLYCLKQSISNCFNVLHLTSQCVNRG